MVSVNPEDLEEGACPPMMRSTWAKWAASETRERFGSASSDITLGQRSSVHKTDSFAPLSHGIHPKTDVKQE